MYSHAYLRNLLESDEDIQRAKKIYDLMSNLSHFDETGIQNIRISQISLKDIRWKMENNMNPEYREIIEPAFIKCTQKYNELLDDLYAKVGEMEVPLNKKSRIEEYYKRLSTEVYVKKQTFPSWDSIRMNTSFLSPLIDEYNEELYEEMKPYWNELVEAYYKCMNLMRDKLKELLATEVKETTKVVNNVFLYEILSQFITVNKLEDNTYQANTKIPVVFIDKGDSIDIKFPNIKSSEVASISKKYFINCIGKFIDKVNSVESIDFLKHVLDESDVLQSEVRSYLWNN